jgi:hypothetical protein
MTIRNCTSCGLPVVELRGEFEKLDPLYTRGSSVPDETVGWWHARCLASSDAAIVWYEARLKNYREMRRWTTVADLEEWTVIEEPRGGARLALGHNGQILDVPATSGVAARPVAGGHVYPMVWPEYNLNLEPTNENAATIAAIQDALASNGTYPVPELFAALGVADKVLHPEALELGIFRFDGGVRRNWGRYSVGARAEYGVFMPSALEPYATSESNGRGAR